MSTTALPQSRSGEADGERHLQVSRYDRAASLLLALLLLIGLTVACLLIIWLSGRIFLPQVAVPVTLTELSGGTESGVLGESLELAAPTAEEIAQETDLEFPQFEQTLAAVADAIASRQADLLDPLLTENPRSGPAGGSQGTGNQPALGSGEGSGGFPRAQRWEIRLAEGRTLRAYAELLDYFGIELGAVGATSQVIYASQLSAAEPQTRTGPRHTEQRMYMSYRGGPLAEADRQLIAKAGIDLSGKVVLQFLPADLENQLAQLEREFAGRQPNDIRQTVFGVRGSGGSRVFYVVSQNYW